MTYQDCEEVPRIHRLGTQFRDLNLHFAGYLNFAISKAVQRFGSESKEDVISMVVEILEAELQRFSREREELGRKQSTGFFSLFRGRK